MQCIKLVCGFDQNLLSTEESCLLIGGKKSGAPNEKKYENA